MNKKYLLWFIMLLSGALSAQTIIVAPDAIPSEKTAAEELRKELKALFCRDFPIAQKAEGKKIYVGQSQENAVKFNVEWNQLRPDEILIASSRNGDVYLAGARPRGTLYAVYEYLERAYGVRFWTARVTEYPKYPGYFQTDLAYRYAPQFFIREIGCDLIWSLPFGVKMRNNGHWFKIPEKWGGHVETLGACHTFDQLIPADKELKKHPDWFSLVKNKRVGGHGSGQLCMTNAEMRKELIRRAKEWLQANPDIRIISISQNDCNSFCECSNCREFIKNHGNLSDLLVDFVNEAAEELEKSKPGILVETLAYNPTRTAPKTIRARDNVIIRFCALIPRTEDLKDAGVSREFPAWAAKASKLNAWHYTANYSAYYYPYPLWNELGDEMKLFATNKAIAIFEDTTSGGVRAAGDLADLRCYLLAKLAWDPYCDSKKLREEFIDGYYKKAAPFIRRYIEITSEAHMRNRKVNIRDSEPDAWLTSDEFAACYQSMEDAKKAVSDNSEILRRVEDAALNVRFTLFNFAPYRKHSMFKNMDWEKLFDETMVQAARANVTLVSSVPVTRLDDQKNVWALDLGIAKNPGTEPPEATGKKWYARNAVGVTCYFVNQGWCYKEPDSLASIGRAVRMPANQYNWGVQMHQLPEMNADVYVELRRDGTGKPDSYDAVEIGLYNKKTKQRLSKLIAADELSDCEYRRYKIDGTKLGNDWYIWIAPYSNDSIKNIWVDRIILVEKK